MKQEGQPGQPEQLLPEHPERRGRSSQRALVAMSGGVDSSVAALLAMRAGHDCVGITMKLFENEDMEKGVGDSRPCCSLADAADASRVCATIGIPHYVFDFTLDFRRDVIGRFVDAYGRGETPNPCIDCNRYIKYERLYQRMQSMGFDLIVTGHYARISFDEERGRWLLKTGLDGSKDQSYFLYAMTQEQLAHVRFPLGDLEKTEVRRIADAHGFVNAAKPDSQDICFVPDGGYANFIEAWTGRKGQSGNFVDSHGAVLGQHEGVTRFTVGQRKGLGITFGKPMYVTGIRAEANEVVLGEGEELLSHELLARDANLISVPRIDTPMRVTAKIRYSQEAKPATVAQREDGSLHVAFDEPQRAITPGQAVVLYDGDTVVGGGTIR